MLPILNVGPVAVQLPGLILIAGIWLGLLLAERNANRYDISPAGLNNMIFVALISGVLGARLIYVISNWEAFADNLGSIFSHNPGLLDAWGGVLCAILAGLIYGQRKQMPFWATLDALTPMLAVLGISVALANLSSGSGYGRPTDLPWGIELLGQKSHPSQVYEAVAATVILGLLWPGRGLVRNARPGVYFLWFIAASAGTRLFLEAFRGNSQLLFSGLRSAQVGAWIVLAASLIGIFYFSRKIPTRTEME